MRVVIHSVNANGTPDTPVYDPDASVKVTEELARAWFETDFPGREITGVTLDGA